MSEILVRTKCERIHLAQHRCQYAFLPEVNVGPLCDGVSTSHGFWSDTLSRLHEILALAMVYAVVSLDICLSRICGMSKGLLPHRFLHSTSLLYRRPPAFPVPTIKGSLVSLCHSLADVEEKTQQLWAIIPKVADAPDELPTLLCKSYAGTCNGVAIGLNRKMKPIASSCKPDRALQPAKLQLKGKLKRSRPWFPQRTV